MLGKKLTDEVWRPITFAPNYKASNLGRIANESTQRALTPTVRSRSIYYIRLVISGHLKILRLDKLIYDTFNNTNTLADRKLELKHLDGDPFNCALDNLKLINKDSIRNYRYWLIKNRMDNPNSLYYVMLSDTGEILKAFVSATMAIEYLQKRTLTKDDKAKFMVSSLSYHVNKAKRAGQSKLYGYYWDRVPLTDEERKQKGLIYRG